MTIHAAKDMIGIRRMMMTIHAAKDMIGIRRMMYLMLLT
jgi:hypothetical protein